MTADGTVALGQLTSGALEGLLILATAVWTGGLVAIFVVARVARHTLRSRDRVAFFRGFGRAYGPVGGIALAMALGCGVALLYGRPEGSDRGPQPGAHRPRRAARTVNSGCPGTTSGARRFTHPG